MKQLVGRLKSANTIFVFLLTYVVLCIIFVDNFYSAYNIRNILSQVCVLLTASCGVHFTVLNGGTDFSTTSVIALTSVVGASIMTQSEGLFSGAWYAVPLAVIVMILIGLLFGVINGLSIITFKMPSFIVTMATQMIGAGIALMFTEGQTIGNLPKSFTIIGTGSIGIFPYAFFVTLLVVLACNTILRQTKLGRQIYAVGTNPKTSSISGVPVKKVIFRLYVISGLCASLAGVQMLSQMQAGAANFASNMFIDIMTSIIVGGTSPIGGRGKITDTMMGAFLVILINISMNLMGVQWYVISIIKGLIILIAVSVDLARKVKVRT